MHTEGGSLSLETEDRGIYGIILYMQRVPEPELMSAFDQAMAYAKADFSEPNSLFIELFKDNFRGLKIKGTVLDLGCGPADISIRFARVYRDCTVHAVDGSEAMLFFAKKAIKNEPLDVRKRIKLYHAVIPRDPLPVEKYDVIISNSLLHHLHDPMVLWQVIKSYSSRGTCVMVMDLIRPATAQMAMQIVQTYASEEPEILQRDFYNSLCAAFRPEEVVQQLREAGLDFMVKVVSDRHMLISGVV